MKTTAADLINKLQDIVHGQYMEADLALCSHGDLQLVPTTANHRITAACKYYNK